MRGEPLGEATFLLLFSPDLSPALLQCAPLHSYTPVNTHSQYVNFTLVRECLEEAAGSHGVDRAQSPGRKTEGSLIVQ